MPVSEPVCAHMPVVSLLVHMPVCVHTICDTVSLLCVIGGYFGDGLLGFRKTMSSDAAVTRSTL